MIFVISSYLNNLKAFVPLAREAKEWISAHLSYRTFVLIPVHLS